MNNTKDLLNLKGKVAIVTGAATGLGAAAAQRLAESGAHVLINHVRGQEAQAQSVSNDCAAHPGCESLCKIGDITVDEQCRSIAQAAIDRWGRVDILINNAGINKLVEHHNLDGLSADDFLRIYNVNVVGAYQMIRAVAPVMQQQGSGVVVNISSAAGESGRGSSVAYAASKGAINTLTKSLGRALAPTIRVNALCPGFIDTPLWDKAELSESERLELKQGNIDAIPLKIDVTAEIVARGILFLASDLSVHMTGQIVTTDGGLLLGLHEPMFEDDSNNPTNSSDNQA